MAPSYCIELSDAERDFLLQIARQSLHTGLQQGEPAAVTLHGLAEALTAPRGVFVTLTQQGRLRGCIGSMEASEPLVSSVAESAYNAAFKDPRFPQLAAQERTQRRWKYPFFHPWNRYLPVLAMNSYPAYGQRWTGCSSRTGTTAQPSCLKSGSNYPTLKHFWITC